MPSYDPDAIWPPYLDLSERGLSWRSMTIGDLLAGRWTRTRRLAHRRAWRTRPR